MSTETSDPRAERRVGFHAVSVQGATKMAATWDSLKDLLDDCKMIFTKNGIFVNSVDVNNIALINLTFWRDSFQKFYSTNNYVLGINVVVLCQVFRVCNKQTKVTFEILEDDPTALYITLSSPSSGVQVDARLNSREIDSKLCVLNNTQFDRFFSLPASSFQNYINYLSQITMSNEEDEKVVTFEVHENCIVLSVRGEGGLVKLALWPTNAGLRVTEGEMDAIRDDDAAEQAGDALECGNEGENEYANDGSVGKRRRSETAGGGGGGGGGGGDDYCNGGKEGGGGSSGSDRTGAVAQAQSAEPSVGRLLFQSKYIIKYLKYITKATPLSLSVKIFLKPNYPAVITYLIGTMGILRYCIARGSLVLLPNGTSVPIETLVASMLSGRRRRLEAAHKNSTFDANVVCRSGDDGHCCGGDRDCGNGHGDEGAVKVAAPLVFPLVSCREAEKCMIVQSFGACVDAMVQGRKKCIVLVLEDGRRLTCTEDHRILTVGGQWMEAAECARTRARVVCSAAISRTVSDDLFLTSEEAVCARTGSGNCFANLCSQTLDENSAQCQKIRALQKLKNDEAQECSAVGLAGTLFPKTNSSATPTSSPDALKLSSGTTLYFSSPIDRRRSAAFCRILGYVVGSRSTVRASVCSSNGRENSICMEEDSQCLLHGAFERGEKEAIGGGIRGLTNAGRVGGGNSDFEKFSSAPWSTRAGKNSIDFYVENVVDVFFSTERDAMEFADDLCLFQQTLQPLRPQMCVVGENANVPFSMNAEKECGSGQCDCSKAPAKAKSGEHGAKDVGDCNSGAGKRWSSSIQPSCCCEKKVGATWMLSFADPLVELDFLETIGTDYVREFLSGLFGAGGTPPFLKPIVPIRSGDCSDVPAAGGAPNMSRLKTGAHCAFGAAELLSSVADDCPTATDGGYFTEIEFCASAGEFGRLRSVVGLFARCGVPSRLDTAGFRVVVSAAEKFAENIGFMFCAQKSYYLGVAVVCRRIERQSVANVPAGSRAVPFDICATLERIGALSFFSLQENTYSGNDKTNDNNDDCFSVHSDTKEYFGCRKDTDAAGLVKDDCKKERLWKEERTCAENPTPCLLMDETADACSDGTSQTPCEDHGAALESSRGRFQQSPDYNYEPLVERASLCLPTISLAVSLCEDVGFRDTFDISVERLHAFFADGVAVHNCLSEKTSDAVEDQMDDLDAFDGGGGGGGANGGDDDDDEGE